MPDIHPVEAGASLDAVGVVVAVPPRFERCVFRGHDDLGGRERRAELGGECSRGVPDASPQLSDVGPAERLAEHPDGPGRRVLVHRGDSQQGRLAAAVGPEHEPVLTAADLERDLVEDAPTLAFEHHAVDVEGRFVMRFRRRHAPCVAVRHPDDETLRHGRPGTATTDTLAPMTSAARRLLVLCCSAAALLSSAAPVGAQTQEDPAERAAREITAARDRANQAAEDYFAAESQLEILELQQDRLVVELEDLAFVVEELRLAVELAAVNRFVASGTSGIPILTDLRDPTEQLHGDVLARVVAETGATTLDDYDAARDALDVKQLELEAGERAVERQQDELLQFQADAEAEVERLREIESSRLDDEAVAVALEAQERVRARQLDELLRRQAEAARTAAPDPAAGVGVGAAVAAITSEGTTTGRVGASGGAAGGRTGGGGAGTNPRAAGNGYVDAILCPVQGLSAYGDTWGAPRSGGRRHQGVDMLAVMGTPLQAVVSGAVEHRSNRLGGITIALLGDNGNRYYYAHLIGYEGLPGRVEQAQVIGYMGDSGNATGIPHLHFEIRPLGGVPVNPYPSVLGAAC